MSCWLQSQGCNQAWAVKENKLSKLLMIIAKKNYFLKIVKVIEAESVITTVI